MNLTIDAGNTSIKIMVFNAKVPVFRDEVKKLNLTVLKKLFRAFPIRNSILSAVIPVPPPVVTFLKNKSRYIRLSSATAIPVKNRYETPKTLGNDRLAAAIAGNYLFPKQNVLVIDVGTCIKYDFVNAKAEYLGGSISPGMNMRFRALHQFTAKLPLAGHAKLNSFIGRNTVTALQTGVLTGMVQEISGFISLYKKKYPRLKVVLTGGDCVRFAGQLNLSIFAAPDLVSLGLNEIIAHNVKK